MGASWLSSHSTRLSAYWNARTEGSTNEEIDHLAASLDPDLVTTIERLDESNDAFTPDPDVLARMERDLMHAASLHPRPPSALAALAPAPVVPSGLPGNGRYRPDVGERRRGTPSRVRRWAAGELATGVLVVLVIIGAAFALYDNRPAALPPIQATPTTEPATPNAWPMYRGNPARTGEMPGPGIQGQPEIAWTFAAGSSVIRAPAVMDGVVYQPSADGPFFALDATTGEVLWQTTTFGAIPSAANGIVYLTQGDVLEELVALDAATQQELWRYPAGAGQWTPLLLDDTVYYGSDPELLVALDARTGEVRWRSAQLGRASRSAAFGEGVLVVGSDDDKFLYGIDFEDGATLWSRPIEGGGIIQTPAIVDGVAYVGNFDGDTHAFYAVDVATGAELWRFDGEDDEGFGAAGAAGGLVFVPGRGGTFSALDAATGEPRWAFVGDAGFESALAIVDGVVYAADAAGVLYAWEAATGAERWRIALDGPVFVGLVVVDGYLYVGTEAGTVYAIAGSEDDEAPGAIPMGTPEGTPEGTPAAMTVPDATPSPSSATPVVAGNPFALEWITPTSGPGAIDEPSDIGIDPFGRIWISDVTTNQFFIYDLDGNFLEAWGGAGSGEGQFNFIGPNAAAGKIAFAPDGTFYVADIGNGRVQKFGPDRSFVKSWGTDGNGTGDGQLIQPVGIALAADGTLWVSDVTRNDVQRFDADGAFLGKFGGRGPGPGQFIDPGMITVAPDGTLWVADSRNDRVQHFDAQGTYLGEIGGRGTGPGQFRLTWEVAFDAAGTIFATDQEGHRLLVFAADGTFLMELTGAGTDYGPFAGANSVVIYRGTSLFFVDWPNGRVLKFKLLPPLGPA